MIKIPNNQQWSQFNEGDIFGSIWSSSNLDLNIKKGDIRISPRMALNSNTTDLPNLGIPCVFKYFNTPVGNLWTIAGSKIFRADGAQSSFFEEEDDLSAPTNANSDYSDMEVFNSSLYFTTASRNLYTISSVGAYATLSNKLADSGGLHDLEYFRALNRLYFVDDNSKSIGSIDTSNTSATLGNQYTLNALVNGSSQVISWIKSTSSRIYIGTINYTGKDGYVYGWDGSQTTPNESYRLNSAGSLACVIKDDAPYILDVNGKLLTFNGATFTGRDGRDYLAKFPIDEKIFGSYFSTATNRPVHYNGMTLNERDRIQIFVNTAPWTTNFPSSVLDENCPSGIWEYDNESNLYHKNSIGYSKEVSSIVDYGQKKISKIGAIAHIRLPDSDFTAGTTNGTYLVGAQYFKTDLTTDYGIFFDDSNDTLQKSGYFVTPKIYASTFKDNFETLYARFKKFANATDKMVIKVRTDEIDSVEGSITWLDNSDNNVFTTTADLSDFSKGDEVEILQGNLAGICSHIDEIDGAYTIKLEDSFSSLSSLSGTKGVARFQKWKKIATVNTTDDKTVMAKIDELGSSWVQFKVWVIVTGKWDFHDMIITNKAQI